MKTQPVGEVVVLFCVNQPDLIKGRVVLPLTGKCLSFMAVGTNSPLILLMPEVGLLYILSSSDPLCWGKRTGQAL